MVGCLTSQQHASVSQGRGQRGMIAGSPLPNALLLHHLGGGDNNTNDGDGGGDHDVGGERRRLYNNDNGNKIMINRRRQKAKKSRVTGTERLTASITADSSTYPFVGTKKKTHRNAQTHGRARESGSHGTNSVTVQPRATKSHLY